MEKKEDTKAMGTKMTARYVTRTRFVFIVMARLFSSTEMRAVAREMMFEERVSRRSRRARMMRKSERSFDNPFSVLLGMLRG